MSALVLTNTSDNSTIACDDYFDFVDDPNFSAQSLPAFFQIGQDLDAFSAKTALQQLSQNDSLALFGGASVLIPITVSRREVVRFFAVLLFIGAFHFHITCQLL
jgi:hypothetical protein